ncbi:hypothetical protein CROQUDRAFT_664076 [Cronartium quercuum f. sp. fusiforme G11]|uniref:Uncharacterized protein n=1 Tax=Cronartium quercuum f. sp. fusiforme G11 TaxID=708437 RepID=A0A9P6T760_9BASI|nr:hypothetical protein CROQUDRAFT_664076 [Cronartium quercuum f. sp. fusiforme G11]
MWVGILSLLTYWEVNRNHLNSQKLGLIMFACKNLLPNVTSHAVFKISPLFIRPSTCDQREVTRSRLRRKINLSFSLVFMIPMLTVSLLPIVGDETIAEYD